MMPCQSSDELKKLVDEARKYTSEGKVADYIPELGKPILMIYLLRLITRMVNAFLQVILIKRLLCKVFRRSLA